MKKKLIMFCLAAGLALGISAQDKVQDKDVPAPIQTNFKTQYPDASAVNWKMKEGNYKVHFKQNGFKQLAAYDASGKLLSKGIEIKESELPASISSSVKTGYADRSIDEIYKIEKNGTTSYMVKMKGNPETKLMYSADGQSVKDK